MNKKTLLIHILLIAALGMLVYLPAMRGGFILDDNGLVKDSEIIKSWANFPRIFSGDMGGGSLTPYVSYRPLVTLTFMADHSFWKLERLGYHLTNIAFHVLVALCLYWFLALLFGNATLSLLASVFFVVHPVHTEAVAYIAGRNDCLSLLFMLLTFIFYLKRCRAKRLIYLCFMVLSFSLALLSKENALILPVLLLLYYYAFKKKEGLRDIVSLVITTGFYLVLRWLVLKGNAPPMSTVVVGSVFERLPGVFAALFQYLRLLVLPIDLHMDYGKRLFSFMDAKVLLGVAAALFLLVFAFKKRKSDPFLFFSVGWFFIALLPVANIYPLPFYMAEHWLYVPSIGFFLLLARSFSRLLKEKKSRLFAGILCVALVCSWSLVTFWQAAYWRDPLLFYQRTISFDPQNEALYNNLGSVYEEQGDTQKAIAAYRMSRGLEPNFIRAYNNLGRLYSKLGRYPEAIEIYRQAIAINPGYADLYGNLGTIYARLGKREEAIALLKKAVTLKPNDAVAYYNLGNIYFDLARYDEAIMVYQKAVHFDPTYGKAYGNMAIACYYKKDYARAIIYADRAKREGSFNRDLAEALKPYRKNAE